MRFGRSRKCPIAHVASSHDSATTAHAYRRREALDLNAFEVYDTRRKMREYLILMGFGVVSLGLAMSGGWRVPASGWIYALIGRCSRRTAISQGGTGQSTPSRCGCGRVDERQR
jgi:hypothetical protein